MLQSQIDALKDEVTELKRRLDAISPVIPWHEAPSWANYVAMDADYQWWWYANEPDLNETESLWRITNTHDTCKRADIKVDCNWRTSLQKRP